MLRALRKLFTSARCKTDRPRPVRLGLEQLEERQVPTVTYHGGPLLPHVEVQGVYYGSDWKTNPTYFAQTGQLDGYLKYLVNSPYMDMLSNAGYDVYRGSATQGQIVLANVNKGNYLTDATIQQNLQALVKGGSLQPPDANRLYVVFVEDGVAVQTADGENSETNFLGYHTAFRGTTAAGASTTINYAVITYPGGINASEGGYAAFDSMTVVASHEISEAVTDPVPYNPGGWYDGNAPKAKGQEIGDLVAHQDVNFNGYAVQKEADKNDNAMTPTKYASKATLSTSSSSIVWGSAVTFRATLYGVYTPTGTVSFYDNGAYLGSATLQFQSGDLVDDAFTSFTVSTLLPGSHSITVSYGGDGNEAASTSAPLTLTVISPTVSTATTLVANIDPASLGQAVTFTATVATGGATPTGTVTFYDGATALGTANVQRVNGTAQATFTTSSLAVGSHSVSARYGGDGAHGGSISPVIAEAIQSTPPNPGSGQAARETVANELTHSAEYFSDFASAAYLKYLGRKPEAAGLAYWVNLMQHGLSDERLEAGFIGSAEYIGNHGGTGPNWINGLYVDLLGRKPMPQEVQYWVNNLDNGMSPANIAFGFAASRERETQRVGEDYQLYLGRNASAAELPYWVNTFLQGADNEQVIAGFVASQEYFQNHGSDINNWLFAGFQATLHRTPDAATAQYFLSQLE